MGNQMTAAPKVLFSGLLGFAALISPCMAEEQKGDEKSPDMAFGAEFFVTNDSDHFQSRRVSVEFFPAFENADRFLGFRLGDY